METKKHRKHGIVGRLLRLGLGALGAIVGLVALYVAAAVPGALIRGDERDAAPDRVYPIYLIWSDLHTDLMLPVSGVTVDWSSVLADPDAPAPPEAGYLAFGWGSESFYTNVPTLADVTPTLIAKALLLDTTVVHVEPLSNPAVIPPEYRRTVLLSAAELAALEQYVLAAFELDAQGLADALPGKSYGRGDAFYRAKGRYGPIRTCNQWTSDALRMVGVPVGSWTPFAQSITWVVGSDAAPRT